MQIITLKINRLFGLYDYTLNFDTQDSFLSLITGPNGYGKTTILKIIRNLNQSNLYYFYSLKYDEIEFCFDDRSVLQISQGYTNQHEELLAGDGLDESFSKIKEVRFVWQKDGKRIATFVYNETNIEKAIKYLRYDVVELRRISYLQHHQRERILLDCPTFNEYIAHSQNQDRFLMQLQTIRTTFVPANRIYVENLSENEQLPILRISSSLQTILEKSKVDFLSYSQYEDSSFIKEILSSKQCEIDKVKYEEICQDLRYQAQKLQSYTFTDNKIEIPEFSEINNSILAQYILHLSKKLHHCDTILNKIILFDEMLKDKHFSNKIISFSSQYGIRAISTNGDFIDIANLSSGEQNEIILLYNLIFEVPDKSILLVDEPENSLHVAWQKKIVSDFGKIAKLKDLQLIVATHSPSIVSQGINVTTDLFYLIKDKTNA